MSAYRRLRSRRSGGFFTRRAHSRILAKTPPRFPSSFAPEASSAVVDEDVDALTVGTLDALAVGTLPVGTLAVADASRALASAFPARIRRNHARAPAAGGGDDSSVDSDSAKACSARNSAAVSSFT